jgi:hypothetical protein
MAVITKDRSIVSVSSARSARAAGTRANRRARAVPVRAALANVAKCGRRHRSVNRARPLDLPVEPGLADAP